jgi:aminoglycoside phosphotransferase (APT) family kinase protein
LSGARSIPTAALAEFLSERLGEPAAIEAASIASEGASDDTWMLSVATDAGRQELVVRRYRHGGTFREDTDPERHFRVLRELPQEGIPVPEALWFEPGEEVAGGPFFVMRRVEGRIVVPWLPAGREFLAAAGDGPLGERFVEILAAIHAIPWQRRFGFLAQGEGGGDGVDPSRRLDQLESMLDRYRTEPEPILADALGWLRHNLPEQERTTVVHGDYRSGNIVFGEDDINAVLDWEFCRIGDPTADLGWLLCSSNRMGSDLACYMMPRERFLELYEQKAGWVPAAPSLRFWEVLQLVFNTLLWVNAEHNYLGGATDDLGLARWTFTVPTLRKLVLDALEAA